MARVARDVVSTVDNEFEEMLGISYGAVHFLLVHRQEPTELICRHVGLAFREPLERLLDFRRRLQLVDLELPVEALEHFVVVTPCVVVLLVIPRHDLLLFPHLYQSFFCLSF